MSVYRITVHLIRITLLIFHSSPLAGGRIKGKEEVLLPASLARQKQEKKINAEPKSSSLEKTVSFTFCQSYGSSDRFAYKGGKYFYQRFEHILYTWCSFYMKDTPLNYSLNYSFTHKCCTIISSHHSSHSRH